METGNSGVLGVTETRYNLEAMKKRYREEYKKIVDKEKKSNSDLIKNKWRLRFGTFTAKVGLMFQPRSAFKTISMLGTSLFRVLGEKAMKIKNKMDKKKYQQQKDRLTADFINAEGEFKDVDIINPATIEEINEEELEYSSGRSR